ncbi:MAG: GTP-binding protein [Gemmatimonadota bacterium]|nr:GTP-binding protein [Gemmatimonadota bacterium]
MVNTNGAWTQAEGRDVVSKKVCLVGSFAVGKTSLVRRTIDDVYDEGYLTTVGVKVDRTEVKIGPRTVNLMLWDLAGEDAFAELRLDYIRGASGLILVADGTRADTIDSAIELKRKINRAFGPLPSVLALNKSDLVASWSISDAHCRILGRSGAWSVVRTSARTGEGVPTLLATLARRMVAP